MTLAKKFLKLRRYFGKFFTGFEGRGFSYYFSLVISVINPEFFFRVFLGPRWVTGWDDVTNVTVTQPSVMRLMNGR